MKPWRVFLAYPETAQPVAVLTFRSDVRALLRVLAEDLNTTTSRLLAGTITEVLRGHLDGLDPASGVCAGRTPAGDPLVFIDLGPGDQTLLDAYTTKPYSGLGRNTPRGARRSAGALACWLEKQIQSLSEVSRFWP